MIVTAVEGASALRPVRLFRKRDELREYSTITFDHPWRGCNFWLRRLSAVGMVTKKSDMMIEILDDNDDIIQEVPITKKGFEYLRRKLRFRWERGE